MTYPIWGHRRLAALHTSLIATLRLPDEPDAIALSALALDIALHRGDNTHGNDPIGRARKVARTAFERRRARTHHARTACHGKSVAALAVVPLRSVLFLVPGPDQYRIRRADHDEGSGAFGDPVRSGHDFVLHRLHRVRHSEQHRSGAH